MAFEDSWLWRTAFIETRNDVSAEEQEYFRQRYLAMREKAGQLVGRIGADMKDMTVHDVTHLDALWEMGSIVCRGAISLNPPEAFVFGGAVLLHDAAMSLAAYADGLSGLKEEVVWKDAYARLIERARDDGREPDESLEAIATAEALRSLHAKQAERLVKMAWSDDNGPEEYLIDDHEVRRFYGPKIGKIAHSHWWHVAKIEEEFSVDLGPLGGRTDHRIDLIKIACLLRIADAMHLDRRRAPSFLRLLVQPEGVSQAHWKFQERMAVPFIDKGGLVYSAATAFDLADADAWWLAYDAISMVDRELRTVDQLMQRRGSQGFLATRAEGASSPEELSLLVETEGWKPINTAVRVSDVPKIISTLGGAKLYGDKPEAAVRELIQNAADAIKARRNLQHRAQDWGTITVQITERDGEWWLSIEDTGVGMSQAVLTGPLIDFGNSFWRSPLAAQEFPGLQAAGIQSTGRYGIGFFATFMLGSYVRVITRRYDQGSDQAAVLEFAHGLGSRPILYASTGGAPIDGGTRVEVRLDRSPFLEKGLLWRSHWGKHAHTLRAFVAALAPAVDVRIETVENGLEGIAVEPSDWLSLNEPRLYARLAKDDDADATEHDQSSDSRLRDLVDIGGKVYGRARIACEVWGSGTRGCLFVGGLRAASTGVFTGLMAGRENTAARDDAVVAVPPQVLKSWADEQATLLAASGEDDEDKARGANAILLFGGTIDALPIARVGETWLRYADAIALIENSDDLLVCFDDPIRYDEDDDDVLPRDFKYYFKRSSDIVFIFKQMPSLKTTEQLMPMIPSIMDINRPRNLSAMFRHLIQQNWTKFTEEEEVVVVGEVDFVKIKRIVTRFIRN